MTTQPPSSSDGSSLPPRHRPSKKDFIKDSTELDLWAFDESSPADEESAPAAPKSGRSSGIPVPRSSVNVRKHPVGNLPKSEESAPAQGSGTEERIQINVSNKRPKAAPASHPVHHSNVGGEFDELDDANEPEPEIVESAPAAERVAVDEVVPLEPAGEETAPETPPPVASLISEQDEFSPRIREDAEPVSLRPHLGLSKVERIGLAALLGVLMIGGGVVYFKTIHRLPAGSGSFEENDFPVKGANLTIVSAVSYWRAPITDGAYVEIVRRGTQLVPVVDLTVRGGPAAVRVFFRDGDGTVIGDAVTRSIQAGGALEVAATAGFEDVGMHAAYRTGQSKPWTVQVYEAPSENSPGPAFKKLFEMNVSTDRR
jgi:hypothetical protein